MAAPPPEFNAYEFVVVASLRAHQLMNGCVPLLDGEHKATRMAQMEVASGKIARLELPATSTVRPAPFL